MKLAIKLSYITLSSLCFNFYCAENMFKADKIIQKSFSTGTPVGKQKAMLEEKKRIKHIAKVEKCIEKQKIVPSKIIFAADDDTTEKALRHNQGLFDQAIRTSK